VIEWRDNGFGLSPSAARNYGCVEMNEKLPVSEKAVASFEIFKTVDSSVSIQLQLFNGNGEFVGFKDLDKDLTGPAKKTYQIGKLELDPAVEKVNFKIWIGSPSKGYVEFKDVSYCY